MVLVVEARYDAVADFYAEGWPDSGDDPVARALLRLCGDVAGERALDLACGHGRIARQLAGRGAIVTGIDVSAALIAKATEAERRQPAGIRYLQADAAAADWLPGARFDAAVCSFGLSDIDDLGGALASVASVTRAGGRFAFSILHPLLSRRARRLRRLARGRLLLRRGMVAGRRGGVFAAAPGRGEPPDPVHLSQCAAAARPVAGRPPRAGPAARMGARPPRRRPHARLPGGTMPQAITAKAAAPSGHAAPGMRSCRMLREELGPRKPGYSLGGLCGLIYAAARQARRRV